MWRNIKSSIGIVGMIVIGVIGVGGFPQHAAISSVHPLPPSDSITNKEELSRLVPITMKSQASGEQTIIWIQSISDSVIIRNIFANHGNCKIISKTEMFNGLSAAMGLPPTSPTNEEIAGSFDPLPNIKNLPVTLKYAEKTSQILNCSDPLDLLIETDQGTVHFSLLF